MVNLGVGGTARNAAPVSLVECVVEASGEVGGSRYAARATRERLDPGATWEWKVAFGEEADASHDDSGGAIVVGTRAAYAG